MLTNCTIDSIVLAVTVSTHEGRLRILIIGLVLSSLASLLSVCVLQWVVNLTSCCYSWSSAVACLGIFCGKIASWIASIIGWIHPLEIWVHLIEILLLSMCDSALSHFWICLILNNGSFIARSRCLIVIAEYLLLLEELRFRIFCLVWELPLFFGEFLGDVRHFLLDVLF